MIILLFLISCMTYKTSLTGVVDYKGATNCAIELNTGVIVILESKVCSQAKEGDTIYFYCDLK